MILGIGLDLVEVERMKQAVANPRFAARVFTEQERAECSKRGKGAAASFAGRFAAKEAFLKALGTGLRGGSLQDIELVNNSLGAPEMKVYGYFSQVCQSYGVQKIWVSLTHERTMAAAQVILIGGETVEDCNRSGNERI